MRCRTLFCLLFPLSYYRPGLLSFKLLVYALLVFSISQSAFAAVLDNNSTISNLSGSKRSQTNFSIDVPEGAANLQIAITGRNGDADLYVKFGSPPTLYSYDYRPRRRGSNESVNIATPSAGTYFIMIRGYRSYYGVTLSVSFDPPVDPVDPADPVIPPDPDGFLQFLNKSAPRNNEGVAEGQAYYRAIDPQNRRLTLDAFKAFNSLSDAENAVYVNDADLGFGRRMYLTAHTDGAVSSCVENFAPIVNGVPDVNAAAADKLALAKEGDPNKIIATVCMEYSGTPGTGSTVGTLTGRKYVKFFSYGAGGVRIVQADLDGRGAKTQPGLCNICHGGQGNSLVNGEYPDNGDTGAQFLPWDLETFLYDTAPGFRRQDLEPIMKRFNTGVLATYPEPSHVYSFRGNVAFPANSSGVAPITVSNMNDPITSITVSIDEDSAGGAGLLNTSGLRGTNIFLVPPAGLFRYPEIVLQNSLVFHNTQATGLRNVFISDTGETAGDLSLVYTDGIASGSSLTLTTLVDDATCRPGSVRATDNLGCASANGVWQLKIQNYNGTGTTNLKAWSIHFNGTPRQSYTPTPVNMIQGWYAATPGDTTLSRSTFNGGFVPEAWQDYNNPLAPASTSQLYLEVIGPTCRACHAQRGSLARNELAFSSYEDFMFYANKTKSLVFDKGLMPLAKRTYESHFWNGTQPDTLAQHMPGYVVGESLPVPGRNIANAGIARVGTLSVAVNQTVNLNGDDSLFPERFSWTVKLGSTNIPVTNANTSTPSFTPALTGLYTVTLDTALPGTGGPLTTSTIDVNVIPALTPVSFRNDIISVNDGTNKAAPMRRCGAEGGCHRKGIGKGPDFKFIVGNTTETTLNEIYRLVRDRSDLDSPMDSLTVRKSLTGESPHAGGFPWPNIDTMIRWVLEGAPNN